MNEMEQHFRDTWAEVSLAAIAHNVQAVKRLYDKKKVEVIAVVKANGYGHGALQVAETALQAGASYLAVALLEEAIQLREAGIKAPILVLGRVSPKYAGLAAEQKISLTVFQKEWLEEAPSYIGPNRTISIHVKFDTGMGRIGMRTKEEAAAFFEYAKEQKAITIEGIYTHFATADELDLGYYEQQHKRFCEMVSWLEEWNVPPPLLHTGNSAAGMRFPEKAFDLFRLGISMYGLTPSPAIKAQLPVELKPAFSLKCRLVQVKKLPAGEAISYGATYRTTGEEWIGTLPIGYADGWLRYHSQRVGEVLVNGKRAPFVGRICMDQCMIRLPGPVEEGTVVTLIGKDGDDEITMDEVAARLETINYEIPCVISERVPRIYI